MERGGSAHLEPEDVFRDPLISQIALTIVNEIEWRVPRQSPRRSPDSWIAPPNSKSFSVSVVLPASGREMTAKVRRRAISSVRVVINRL
jgi:hypothetical protein